MSGGDHPCGPAPGQDAQPAQDPAADARRRRQRAEVFGDVLPEATGDDRDEAGERPGQHPDRSREEWLRANVPPHH